MDHRLLEEVWNGKKVNLSHLKVFDCISYVYIESDAYSKLDANSRKCYFIGYGDKAFGYRFWDDQNRKIIRSRDDTFNEKLCIRMILVQSQQALSQRLRSLKLLD